MPLQHINSRVLKRMQRRVNRDRTLELLDKLADRVPNLVLRTTLVVGFPGETEEQFEELRSFVGGGRFARLGVFPYSPEPGTPAMKLDGHLPKDVREARAEAIMAEQQPHAFAFGDSLIGYELDVLVDEVGEDGVASGRTFADAPEIDGLVHFTTPDAKVGAMVPVELTGRDGYDWLGVASDAAE